VATQSNDNDKRKKVAENWSKEYHVDIKPEDINCDGCLTKTGRVINYCNICEIRACGQKIQVENCAHCSEYPCEKLKKFFEMAPHAKNNLEEIRKNL